MRELLFRGKKVFNDDTCCDGWVYGGVVHQTDYYGDKVDKYFIIDGTDTQDYDIGYEYLVFPEAVGQYTGRKDKRGTRIFEGDILKCDWCNAILIYFDEYWLQFRGKIPEGVSYDIDFYGKKIEVIGNIHDNPELFKEK